MAAPYISIVIPAYNEEKRLFSTLSQIERFINTQPYTAEVLVVENGSQDNTLQVAKSFAADHPGFSVLHETNRGKGGAVKRGMNSARGEFLFMCDADLSMPVSEINRFIPPLLPEMEIAIASREASGAIRYDEPLYRHLGGRLINIIIRIFALPGLHDTQCGFKCFRRDIGIDLFSKQTLTGWSFDIELLYIARRRGYKIVEVPIPWYFNPESKLDIFQDAAKMILDLLIIRRNARRGDYEN